MRPQKVGRVPTPPTCLTRLFRPTRPTWTFQTYLTSLEREPEAELSKALLRLPEVARARRRLHEGGVWNRIRDAAGEAPRDEAAGVLRVEDVEHFTDRGDPCRGAQSECLRDPDVRLTEPVPASALPGWTCPIV